MTGDITGEIHFLTHTTDGFPPWNDASNLASSMSTNFALPLTRLTIYDLRGKEKSVALDINGFELSKYEGFTNNEFDESSEAQQSYYDEISSVLEKRLNASRVVVFNHLFRYRGLPRPDVQCNAKYKDPVFCPHVDYTSLSARLKVKEVLGEDEAKKVMQHRFQLINVWRPLGPNAITYKPLTICDYSSLDIVNDLHPLEVRGSKNTASAYTVSCKTPNSQRWCYLSEMRSDEMFIMKMFDSKSDVAQFGVHTAFINEHVPPSNVEQKSIEIRCIVLYNQ